MHSLEHGAVWIAYNPDQVVGDALETLRKKVDGERYMVMSPYPGLDAPVSLQSWGHQLKVGDVNDALYVAALVLFIAALAVGPRPYARSWASMIDSFAVVLGLAFGTWHLIAAPYVASGRLDSGGVAFFLTELAPPWLGRALGFVIPRDMQSNYTHTLHSLTSLLNFEHVTQLTEDAGPRNPDFSIEAHLVAPR